MKWLLCITKGESTGKAAAIIKVAGKETEVMIVVINGSAFNAKCIGLSKKGLLRFCVFCVFLVNALSRFPPFFLLFSAFVLRGITLKINNHN